VIESGGNDAISLRAESCEVGVPPRRDSRSGAIATKPFGCLAHEIGDAEDLVDDDHGRCGLRTLGVGEIGGDRVFAAEELDVLRMNIRRRRRPVDAG
jgi:hypothetical protein